MSGCGPDEFYSALVGDAAHPTRPSLGQGANMALEDAVQLALSLHETGSVSLGFTVMFGVVFDLVPAKGALFVLCLCCVFCVDARSLRLLGRHVVYPEHMIGDDRRW